jgi:trimethylamine---corrinoid protein Co-methyltransferase
VTDALTLSPSAPHYTRLFTDAEIERIVDGAVSVLLNTGFRVQERTILERLERRGARVDYAAEAFWPTRAMLAELIDCARRHAPPPPAERILRQPLPAGEAAVYNAPLYYDGLTGARRVACLEDVRAMLKACHGLPELDRVGPVLTAQDVPPPIEPLVGVAEAIKTTDKQVLAVELVLGDQLPFMEELETISRGQQVRYRNAGTSIDRFTIDARGARHLMVTWRRNGLEHWWVASCPTAGATAPVTLAGAVTVGVAESLGGWCAGWALEEDTSFGLSPCSSSLDMRTTRVLFSSPEAVLIDAGQYQVLERLTGVQAQMLADYTDAKLPGMQAMNDKVFKALAYASLTAGPINHHYGKLDAGKAWSPAQMLIDFEVNREIRQLQRGIEVNDDTLALDLIQSRARDHSHNYLETEHTYRHFRQTLWHPQWMDRTSWISTAEEREKEHIMVERAEARWRDALARYQPPNIPREKVQAAEGVIAAARKALL